MSNIIFFFSVHCLTGVLHVVGDCLTFFFIPAIKGGLYKGGPKDELHIFFYFAIVSREVVGRLIQPMLIVFRARGVVEKLDLDVRDSL